MQRVRVQEDPDAGGSESIRIASLSEDDVRRVAAIERESHVEPWSEESFRKELQRPVSHLWVVRLSLCSDLQETGGEAHRASDAPSVNVSDWIAGYLCCWLVADELQILNVTVEKKWRRRGIGKALLSHALRWGKARQARVAVLEVRKSNLAAQSLYENLGFHTVGERPDYYGVVKEAAVLMERVIADE